MSDDLFKLEAILFGQAGMLNSNFEDEYPNLLKKEYDFQKLKLGLEPMGEHLWKFFRLRPANFPSIRISQFANLIYNSSKLFSHILKVKKFENVSSLFDLNASDYWRKHYKFDSKESKSKVKRVGDTLVKSITINTISPFLFRLW